MIKFALLQEQSVDYGAFGYLRGVFDTLEDLYRAYPKLKGMTASPDMSATEERNEDGTPVNPDDFEACWAAMDEYQAKRRQADELLEAIEQGVTDYRDDFKIHEIEMNEAVNVYVGGSCE